MIKSINEECGIFGIYTNEISNYATYSTYYALYALQHRGQESCGIAANDRGVISIKKDIGLVSQVFNTKTLNELGSASMAIGHVRYSTSGAINLANAQPLHIKHIKGPLVIAHNGNITNAVELRQKFEENGAIFYGTSDSEIIAYLIAANRLKLNSIEAAVKESVKTLKGAFSLIIMSAQKLIAVRDMTGFKPLCIGKNKQNGAIVFSSESCALSAAQANFVRDVRPGELITIENGQMHCDTSMCSKKSHLCVFEYIYFSRPDSTIENISVYDARIEMGRLLAMQNPVEADVVIGVPFSGLVAAKGFSLESKIPYCDGFVKNSYIGRSFIEPTKSLRENTIKIKLSVIKSVVANKRVVVVDDSIVRGSTSKKIVKMLKEAGAKEVHVRISSPEFKHPCYFGTDVDGTENLIACKMTTKEIATHIGADSLSYLSVENIKKFKLPESEHFCTGCFNGVYPDWVPTNLRKNKFEQKIEKTNLIKDKVQKNETKQQQ